MIAAAFWTLLAIAGAAYVVIVMTGNQGGE